MLGRFALLLLLFCGNLCAQYQFKGSLSPSKSGEPVYLSLLEDYRKTSRAYTHQIIQKTVVDSLGQFVFEGGSLSKANRIYAVHMDHCAESANGGNHFLTHCPRTQRLMFIANAKDTLEIPLLQNNQAFCSIVSKNPASPLLLEFESLKEEMILDFMDVTSGANQAFLMRQWFKKLQDFANESSDPLLALQVFAFLSDPANETSDFYRKNLEETTFYTDLEQGLQQQYPNASFTQKYANELHRDRTDNSTGNRGTTFISTPVFGAITVFLFVVIVLFFYVSKQNKKNQHPFNTDSLSPQEIKVYKAIRRGQTNKEIAAELFISLSTVKTHINNIYKKLGVSTRKDITM